LAETESVIIRQIGRAGRITLNRPKALNALDLDMVRAIEAALKRWRDDQDIALVVIDAADEKAFCAGGDIAALYHQGKAGRFEPGREFWAEEYRLNRMIARYPKPYVALMDGIVMGGGVGLSAHGDVRVVTERSMVAMPECGIGLIPDVGATRLLATAPGRLGEYLGLTGFRMKAADAILAGFADAHVPAERLAELTARLEETGDAGVVESFATPPEPGKLEARRDEIDRLFAGEDAVAILTALESEETEFAAETAKAIRRGSPLSVAVTLALVRLVRDNPTIETALTHEYRYTYRSQSHGDFVEGTRAVVIDKDRNPQWPVARQEDLPRESVEAVMAPLGDDELRFDAK